MKEKKNNKKTLFIILGIILLGLLTIAGTYAYFAWNSTAEGKDATLAVSSVTADGVCDKATDNNKILFPVSSKNSGRIVTVSTKQRLSEYAFVSWSLTINKINTPETLTTGLKHRTFRYELVNTTTGVVYGSGNFAGVQEGDTIVIDNISETLAYNTDYTFTLYLWIDGAMGTNPMDMTDQTYEFDLVCNMTGAPKSTGDYLMVQPYTVNASGSPVRVANNVLGKSINPNLFESIDTLNSVTVPSDIPDDRKWDVSNSQNGSVMAWYTDTDGDGKYELHIGQDGGVIANPDSARLFSGFTNITTLDLTNYNTKLVKYFTYFANGCKNITTLNVSHFDTSLATNLAGFVSNCTKLQTVDVSNFDTSNVTTMQGMFYADPALTSLDLTKFDTSKVTNMGMMFYNCSALTSLDLSSFRTTNVTTMDLMFRGCTGLTTLDLSSFVTPNVTNMGGMFVRCTGLTSLNISNFDTSKVETFSSFLQYCESLTSIDVSSFDTSSATNMAAMFGGMSAITELDLSSFDTSKVTTMNNMLSMCPKLKTVYVSNLWTTDKVNSEDYIFASNTALTGQDGTKYTSSHINKEYARIDDLPDTPGYFTYKAHN